MLSALYAIARSSVCLYGESMACRQRRRFMLMSLLSDGTKSPRMVRIVRGTKGTKNPRMVRKIHGTKRPRYEKSTYGTKRLWYEKSGSRRPLLSWNFSDMS